MNYCLLRYRGYLGFYDPSRGHTISDQLEEIRKMEIDQLYHASFNVIYDRWSIRWIFVTSFESRSDHMKLMSIIKTINRKTERSGGAVLLRLITSIAEAYLFFSLLASFDWCVNIMLLLLLLSIHSNRKIEPLRRDQCCDDWRLLLPIVGTWFSI